MTNLRERRINAQINTKKDILILFSMENVNYIFITNIHCVNNLSHFKSEINYVCYEFLFTFRRFLVDIYDISLFEFDHGELCIFISQVLIALVNLKK